MCPELFNWAYVLHCITLEDVKVSDQKATCILPSAFYKLECTSLLYGNEFY